MKLYSVYIVVFILLTCFNSLAQTKVYTPLYDNSNFNRAIDLTKPVGTVAGGASVSASGGANYSIPIALPPGTNGHVPSLSVNYNSHAANGVLGFGWSLGGLSAITRSKKDWYHEPNEVGPTENLPSDQYALDGSRLMLLSGAQGMAGSIYGTETENYARIEAMGTNANGPNWFRVISKEGVIMEYGNSPTSQFIHSYGHKVMWRLNKVTDRNGNYYEYIYDNSDDDSRIAEIKYTGNINTGLSPYNHVYFDYSIRQDQNAVYEAGFAYKMKYILDRIRVKAQNGIQFKTYTFNHGYDDVYSYLTEVKEEGSDGTELNSTIFKYGEQPEDIVETEQDFLEGSANISYSGDFDGDGYTDILAPEYNLSNGVKLLINLKIWKRTKSNPNFSLSYFTNLNGNFEINPDLQNTAFNNNEIFPTDFDGDGRDDILVIKTSSMLSSGKRDVDEFTIYYPNQNATSMTPVSIQPISSFNKINDVTSKYLSIGDFDANGKSDFITYLTDGIKYQFVYNIPTPSGATQHIINDQVPGGNKLPFSGNNFTIDFNGDGKTEIMCIYFNDCYIYSLEKDVSGTYNLEQIYHTGYPTESHNIYPADFNGDGKTDILTFTGNGTSEVSYSTGISWDSQPFNFATPVAVTVPPNTQGGIDDPLVIADYNGDGKADIAHVRPNSTNTHINVYFSKGNSFAYEQFNHSLASFSPDVFPVDFNGDGRAEIPNFLGSYTSTPFKVIEIKPFGQERLLEKVTNGFNATEEFAYGRLNDASHYSRNIPASNPYPLNYIQGPLYNVVTAKSPDGIGGTNLSHYNYEDAVIHRAGRGFLGYKKITTSNPTANGKTIVEQEINVAHYVPLHKKTQLFRLDNNQLLSETASSFNVSSLSNNRFKIEQYYSGTYDTRLNTSNTQTNTFDNSGNITQSVASIAGGLETTTSQTTFASLGNSLPFLPLSATTTKDRSGPGTPAVTATTNFTYDAAGNVLSKINFAGLPKEVETSYTYNNFGQVLSETLSAQGLIDRASTYFYDLKGRFLIAAQKSCSSCGANANQRETYNNHILWGKPVTLESSDCLITRNEYDGFGRIIETTFPNSTQRNTSYLWENVGNELYKIQTTETDKPTSITYYDMLNREVEAWTESIHGQGIKQKKSYNSKGLLLTQTNSYKSGIEVPITTSFTYDVLNRPLTESNPLSSTSYSYTYNPTTHMLTKEAIPTSGKFSKSISDASGKVLQSEDPGGRVTFLYDSWGNKKIISQNGTTVSNMTYDVYNRKIQTVEKNAGTLNYNYNAYGELILQTDASGNTHEFTYDDLGRMIQRSGPEGVTSYEYYCRQGGDAQYDPGDDEIGGGDDIFAEETGPFTIKWCCNNNLVKIIGFDNTIEDFEYDNLGQLIAKHQTINNNVHTTEYSYLTNGNLSNITYPSGIGIDYHYDAQSHLIALYRTGGPLLYETQSANGMGQITEYQLGNGFTSTNSYSLGFPVKYETPTIQNLSMNWDMTTASLLERTNHLITNTESFIYDILNRLIAYQSNNVGLTNTHYDPFPNTGASNNNIELRDDAGAYSYTVPQMHTMSSIKNPNSNTLPPPNISDITQSIEYTGFQRVEAINEGTYTQDFDYWPGYNRVKSNLYKNGILEETRIHLGDYEIQEIPNNSITNQIHYIDGPNGLCAVIVLDQTNTEQIYYTYNDHLGSINKVTNASGNIVADQSFDAWGRARNPQDWTYTPNPTSKPDWLYRGFTGHEHMPEFKLINMNARLYDPVTGKLISPDNFVADPFSSQAYNRYAYANNNPLLYTDPDGNWVHIVAGAVIGGFINLGVQMYKGNVTDVLDGFKAFGVGALAGGIGAATGGASLAAYSGAAVTTTVAAGSGGFAGGLVSGAVGGGFSSLTLTAGNVFVMNDKDPTQSIGEQLVRNTLLGMATGGALGGVGNGLSAASQGRNFWTGAAPVDKIQSMVPMPVRELNNTTSNNPMLNKGNEGLNSLKIQQNTARIYDKNFTAKYRIPDEMITLDGQARMIGEVKNYRIDRVLYRNKQLVDFMNYSRTHNIPFKLYLNEGVKIGKSFSELISQYPLTELIRY